MYLIYKYTNKHNNKVYIGQTIKSLEERAQSNGGNYRQCPKFYNAIKKYGWDAFVPEIIDTADTKKEADEKEKFYIKVYKSTEDAFGYNIDLGGHGGSLPQEARDKISQKAKERYRDKTKNPMYGKKHSEESRKKQSMKKTGQNNPMYGTTWNDKQRTNCGTKGKTLNLTDEQRNILRERMREIGKRIVTPIRCVSDGMEFASCKSASEFYNIPRPTITDNLKGRSKTCHGLVFEYI